MAPRVHLDEQEEAAERASRDRLHQIDAKLKDLYDRRAAQLAEVHRLSDAQRDLADRRAPQQDAVEGAHRRQRELTQVIGDLRRRRDDARRAVEEAIADLREARASGPRGERPRPELLRRELAQAELRQQTSALPIAEENALIGRMRELRKELTKLEKEAGALQEREGRLKQLEEAVRTRREELEQIGKAADAARRDRDAAGGSVRQQLVESGKIYAELREKATLRRESMARVETLSKEIYVLESEGNRLLRESRNRRFEAQRSVKEYNRSVRDAVGGRDRLAEVAEAQFEELLKRGRITLGGGSGT